jgi:hypothetical protein
MFRLLIQRLAVLVSLFVVLPAAVQADETGSPSPFLEEIGLTSSLPATGNYVFLFSPGGSVDGAFALVPQLKDKTCIVFAAASAALMIVLPACKERYFVQGAVVQFHSAGVVLPPAYFLNQWDARQLAIELERANLRIITHMVLHGVPWSPEFLDQAMKTDAVFVGEQLGQWGTWLRPVEQCTHCPFWTQIVRMPAAASPEL